jgi:DNA-directed RNA polymerase specialized sigma24 family protein
VDDRPTAKEVTDSVPGQPSAVADDRGASPFDLWRPSVRRDDRRVRLYPRRDGNALARFRRTILRSCCRRKPGQTLLRHALTRLSPEHGEVIDLVYFHGKSVKEVAEVVGIAEATVKTRMFYARKKLADLLAAA